MKAREFGEVWALVKDIPSWVQINEARYMWELAVAARAGALRTGLVPIAVDLGVARGRSAIVLARAGYGVIGVSLWNDPDEGTFDDCVANLRNAGCGGLVALLRGDTREVWRRVRDVLDGKVSLLFVDGGHEYETVRADLDGWTQMVRVGGYVLCHDYGEGSKFEGVNRAVDEWLARDKDTWRRIGQAGYVLAVQRAR